MAKKSFKGGLDSLLSNADLPQKKTGNKKNNPTEETSKLSEKDKHWLQLKNEKLLKELHLWRTGQLDIQTFTESLQAKNLKYDSDKNIIY